MRRLIVLAAGATALALSLLGVAGPASAADLPVVVSPANGGALPAGSTGPIVIDFPTAGSYDITVTCGDVYIWTNDYGQSYAGRQAVRIDPLVGYETEDIFGITCTIETFSWDDIGAGTATSTFRVLGPTLTLGEVRVSRATFYPTVRDKYRDDTEFRVAVNRSALASMVITSSTGRTVYSASRGFGDGAGTYRWTWRGKTASGKTVRPGRYRVTITGTADGVSRSSSTTVRVVSKKVMRKKTIRKDWLSSRDSTRGSCYTSLDDYDEATTLDCWGGDFAATTFTFKIPANAKDLVWRTSTGRNSLDKCCHGSITKRGDRVSRTRFQVRIQVTGWRSVDVYGARLTYRARVRI